MPLGAQLETPRDLVSLGERGSDLGPKGGVSESLRKAATGSQRPGLTGVHRRRHLLRTESFCIREGKDAAHRMWAGGGGNIQHRLCF